MVLSEQCLLNLVQRSIKKSLVVTENLNVGDILTEKSLTIKRPGNGIAPKFYINILAKVKRPISADSVLLEEDVE